MELGGKDPAYVLPDTNLDYAVENIIDGAFFNSGQCCCSIERCYVHVDIYEEFVRKAVALAKVKLMETILLTISFNHFLSKIKNKDVYSRRT